MDFSPPGSSIHGIFQARILERAAISSSKRSSQPTDWTCIKRCIRMSPALAVGFFITGPPGNPRLDLILPLLIDIFIFKLGIIMIYLFMSAAKPLSNPRPNAAPHLYALCSFCSQYSSSLHPKSLPLKIIPMNCSPLLPPIFHRFVCISIFFYLFMHIPPFPKRIWGGIWDNLKVLSTLRLFDSK